MLRGAILGFGNVAVHGHAPGWRRRRDVEIVAVTDTRPAQRALLGAHLPGVGWRASAEALLAEPGLDFVDICTPPSSHAPLIRAARPRAASSTRSTTGTTRRSSAGRASWSATGGSAG